MVWQTRDCDKPNTGVESSIGDICWTHPDFQVSSAVYSYFHRKEFARFEQNADWFDRFGSIIFRACATAGLPSSD